MAMPNILVVVAVGIILVTTYVLRKFIIAEPSTEMKKAGVLNKEWQEFPLIAKTAITHNTAIYRFGLPKADDVLGLPIGQHISISGVINDKEVLRSYTPTSLDSDAIGYFEILIKSYPEGNISKMVAGLSIGDKIRVRGPKGFYNYKPNMYKKIGMVAGGTGISPMYQIMKAIFNNDNDKTQVFLLYGNQTKDDILLKAELDAMVKAKPEQFNILYLVDKVSDGEKWEGKVGYITPAIMVEHLPSPDISSQLLICGPPPMVSSVKRSAVSLGLQKAKPISKMGDQVFVF
ncbi:cytochrome-b5 reductase Ecym_4348 [Eremothecium cymbalariae DBVPG|uniref:NADH-cytochrome b5 reductase n=1 Tax=Eremothecium cymbalariae (strain CBS 270.75 / DBVPG 7215 / KCTC 17166 / NRRL Y-17582) TaxID=931890 RepID=G8JTQ6_ERECY|nr:hypothetical protein Ecym_4348 [Eremothecium cymbalariae DBVPG\